MLSDVDSDVIDRYGVLNTLVQPDDVPFYGLPFPGFYTQCVMPRTRTIELDVPVAAGVMPRFEQMKGSDGTAIEMDSGTHMRRLVARDRAAGVMHTQVRNRHSRRSIGKLAGSLCVLAAVTLSGVSTVDANQGQPHRPVPIHGVLSGTDGAVPIDTSDRCYGLSNDDGFYQLHYTAAATGVASHLGRVDYVADHCTWVDNPLAPTHGSFGDGTVTITAANGDKLVVDHSGTFEFKDGFSYVAQLWTVNGTESTGRFDGAEGQGTGDLITNLALQTFSGSWSGMIAYDASNQ